MGGGAAAEKKLHDAATKGDVAALQQLLHEDPYLVHGVSFPCSRNLLHIATMWGHASIVEEVLKMGPHLALDLDSKNSSSLHIAAAQGSVEIARRLLSIAPETCWWRDCHDMNPVHIAAINGHVKVLEELLQLGYLCPPAMERVDRGQTVLHLCVKHGQLQALKFLVDELGELSWAKDDDKETLLHLAVRCNQLEAIQYLVGSNIVEKHALNSMGRTALQILNRSHSDTSNYSEIRRILTDVSNQSLLKALPKLTDITMVVVVLIATMAFQASVSPPGGVWQDDNMSSSHRAGEAVMATTRPKIYKHFVRANTTAFISSLVTIFLITTGLPSGHIFFLAVAVYAMWVSLTSIAVSYGVSVMVITPNMEAESVGHIIAAVVAVSLSIVGLIWISEKTRRLYMSWKMKKRWQEDLTADSLIQRVFYSIFQRLEPWVDLTSAR